MRKKFVSALLFGAFITASTSTLLVSCKDYDDDLTEIRGIIAENETDLTSLIEGKVETVNAEIDRLNSQAEELASAYKEADEALQAAIAGAETNANAYADIQRAEAEKASIEAARKMVDEAVATLEASISAANAKIEEQGKSIAALISADAELTKGIEAAKARANEAYALAEKAEKLAEENATEIGGLKTTLSTITTNLQTVKDNLDEEIRLLNGKVADLLAKAETQAATITSLEGQLKSLRESNETAIQNLKDKDSELIEKIEKDNKAIGERLDNEVAKLKKQAEDNLAEAKTYTNAEIQKVSSKIDDLTATVNGVKVNISDLNLAIDGIKVDIKGIENAYKAADTALRTDLEGMIGDLEDQLETLKSNQTSTDNAQNGRIKALEDLLAAIGDGDIKKFSEKVQGMDTNIDDLKGSVTSINASLAYEGKRLKSLVFAPTAYVDGIECIKFTTLQYKDWGTNKNDWEANAAKSGNKSYVIDDAEQLEEYLANPKNVLKSDITSLSFISNKATNTRAVSESAPIAIDKWDITGGVMKLNIKKTVDDSFGTDRNNFTIVALKATLSDKFFTEEEKKNGEKAEVYSDWARLYETSQTPYIHNKTAHDNAGKPTESAEKSHFWNYSTVYNNGTKADALPTEFNKKHIAAEVYYKDNIDLLSLVEVCDKEGTLYDMEKYGLAFEFHVMDYKLKNENEAEKETDQKHFAKLNEDGHTLVSTARDNTTTGNRDAIGRQPMIQAVLKDVRDPKQEKVVDVRYFKIQWIDKIDVKTYGQLDAFEKPYACCEDVKDLRVLEENMNKLYATYDMSRDEFHNKYTLHSGLFESEAEAMKENGTVAAKFGTIADQPDAGGAGQTHNLLWTINTTQNAATQAEYEAGRKEITAWGYYEDKVNPKSRIIFSVKLTLKLTRMAYADGVGKDQTMWKEGARFINPQLESDETYGNASFATTQILGNFLKGYLKNGATPATIDDLVNYGDVTSIVFDEAKLGALAEATSTAKDDWKITNDGLTLNYKNEKAAVISGSDIQLWESQNGEEGSKPSAGAKLLVGKSAPVKLVDKYCTDLIQIIDAYNMNFITPLAITASTKNVEVKDITAGGGSSATLAGSIEVKEVAAANKRVVWNNKTGKDAVNNAVLVKWYGFEVPVYTTDAAKTNIQKNGSIGSACNVLLSDIKNADGTKKYDVEISGTGGDTKVIFKNMSGNAIGQEFKIEIPVTIKTKWQDMEAKVIVTVKPNI